MTKLIRPSDPDLTVSIHSGQNENIVKIPCFLHTSDVDVLYNVVFDFLKKRHKTEAFIDQMEAEQIDFEPYNNLFDFIDQKVNEAAVKLNKRLDQFDSLLFMHEIDLKYGMNYRTEFLNQIIKTVEEL